MTGAAAYLADAPRKALVALALFRRCTGVAQSRRCARGGRMADADDGLPPTTGALEPESPRRRGRPPVHGLKTLRRAVTKLTTRRLDGRSTVAVAARTWKADIRRDLGGDLTRAQETLLESAAQAWIILSSIDDFLAR